MVLAGIIAVLACSEICALLAPELDFVAVKVVLPHPVDNGVPNAAPKVNVGSLREI